MELRINTKPSYSIEFNQSLFKDDTLAQFCKSIANKIVIISDNTVSELYGQALIKLLEKHQFSVYLFSFPPGEHYKTRETKALLEDQMFAKQCMRDTCVIALGGGIVTDMAGYVAATYCRGVPVIYIPTTLLSMVDASIGGKTGVNTPWGKNLVGTFTQPARVYIDVNFLDTLPFDEFSCGMAEVIKHALIADNDLFNLINTHTVSLADKDQLQTVIYRSCDIKRAIVESDPFEKNKRKLLNFGHTAGHAIESASDYTIKHGEAVAIGMMLEAYFSVQLGLMTAQLLPMIKQTLQQYHLPTALPAQLNSNHLIPYFTMDKKVHDNRIYCVLLESIGVPHVVDGQYADEISLDLIKSVIASVGLQ